MLRKENGLLARTMDETHLNQEPSAAEVLRTHLRRPALLLSLLSLGTLVLYSGALFFEFVWDDWPQIVNSPILRSWSNLPRAFNSDLWYHVARHQVYYRPLFVAWSMLNYALFGLHPWGWHLGAILVHVAAVLAVFWLARKLGLEYWTAALAALLFALHPIHIEPVAWISAASDTMVTLFVVLAFAAFLKGRNPEEPNRRLWWLASLPLLACALLSKEMAVTFAALVWTYAWLQPGGKKSSIAQKASGAFAEAAPYAAVTLAYVLLRKHALLHTTGQFDPGHGMVDVLRTLPLVISFYVRKLLLPVGLTGLYYTPYVTSKIVTQFVMPAGFLILSAALLWYWNRREGNPTVAFAGCWFLISLAPALYLRNFGNGDFVRDRYAYLPSVGFAILLAMACRRLPSIKTFTAPAVQAFAAVLLCAFYVAASMAQQVYWDSDLLVLIRGQALYPDNPYTLVGLAAEYSRRGANDRAIELAERAVRIHPEYGYSRLSLAEVYIRAGRYDEGRVWLDQALRANPDYAESETGMAGLAGLYGRMGDYNQAFSLCDQILDKDPYLYSALYNCGNIHLMARQFPEAQQLLARAIQAAPEQAAPKHYLGRALLQDGKSREAQPYLEAAVATDPKVWDYHYWLAVSFEQNHDLPNARTQYQEALRLNPESAEASTRLNALEPK
jgi:tetratricopeptide (TPR) repeat protein